MAGKGGQQPRFLDLLQGREPDRHRPVFAGKPDTHHLAAVERQIRSRRYIGKRVAIAIGDHRADHVGMRDAEGDIGL